MDKFEVGEIAIGQNFEHSLERDGMECEIICSLKERCCIGHTTQKFIVGQMYRVLWADGKISAQFESELRKRPSKENAREWFDEKIKLNPKALEAA